VGLNGNPLNYIAFPYHLPADDITLVVLGNTGSHPPKAWEMIGKIVLIVSPNNPWTNLPRE
jgi:hypothetical protein